MRDGIWIRLRDFRELMKLISEERTRLALKINDPKTTHKGTRTRWKNKARHLTTTERVLRMGPKSRDGRALVEFRPLEQEEALKTLKRLLPKVGTSTFPFAHATLPVQFPLARVREAIERFETRHPLIKLAEVAADEQKVSNPKTTGLDSTRKGR